MGEEIVLPGIETTVVIVAIKGQVARLGISAPAQITVQRAEIGKHFEHAWPSIGAANDHAKFSSPE
jgi:sRNA-binding carbon storage regulator CsrA